MSEEKQSPFIAKMGLVQGFNANGEFSFWSGSIRAKKGQEVMKDYYKENKKDLEKTDLGRHRIPVSVTKIPDNYINKEAKYPKTHSILVGEVMIGVPEDLEHDTKITTKIDI